MKSFRFEPGYHSLQVYRVVSCRLLGIPKVSILLKQSLKELQDAKLKFTYWSPTSASTNTPPGGAVSISESIETVCSEKIVQLNQVRRAILQEYNQAQYAFNKTMTRKKLQFASNVAVCYDLRRKPCRVIPRIKLYN